MRSPIEVEDTSIISCQCWKIINSILGLSQNSLAFLLHVSAKSQLLRLQAKWITQNFHAQVDLGIATIQGFQWSMQNAATQSGTWQNVEQKVLIDKIKELSLEQTPHWVFFSMFSIPPPTHIYLWSSSTQGRRITRAYQRSIPDWRQGYTLEKLPVYHDSLCKRFFLSYWCHSQHKRCSLVVWQLID